jgi:4-azaleucine resistance transporter AzlC
LNTVPQPTRRGEFLAGTKATIPLVVSGIPFGIIFGALAVSSGFTPVQTIALSAFVFAGSAQFIATGMYAAGAAAPIIILTTFVVNARHALYSASLAPYARHLPQRWLLPLGFSLTDETFVIAIARYQQTDESPYKHWFWLGSAIFMYVSWQLSTWVGIIAGGSIPDPISWGLDFAMYVTFLGMLVPMVRTRPPLAAALVAAFVAVAARGLPNQIGLLIATVAGVLAGVVFESMAKESTQRRKDAEAQTSG